ncbi:MAG TPA: hypothetical protein PKE29_02685 [Phycisphaerales bacterium]|nr:hypothetical protein [Phycisphaerales bacterium]
MNTIAYVFTGLKDFEDRGEPERLIRRLNALQLIKVSVQPFGTEGFGSVTFDCDSEAVGRLHDLLDARGIQHSTRWETRYSNVELDGAQLLDVSLDLAPSADLTGDIGISLAEPGICPECWSGARVVPPASIEIERLALRHPINQTNDNRLFVDDGVRARLIESGAGESDFLEVAAVAESSRQDMGTFHIIQPLAVLPPLDVSTRGLIRSGNPQDAPCARCSRDGFYHTPNEPFLPVLKVANIKSLLADSESRPFLARTWECYGIGRRPGRPRSDPPVSGLVINQAARQVLRKCCKARFRWTPIALI